MNIVKQCVKNRYDRANFIKLAREILPFNIEEVPIPIELTEKERERVETFNYFGETQTGGKTIAILGVKLKNTKLKRSPTFQRNLVAKYLKDKTFDAAIVAFYSDNEPAWKLSLVTVEYKLDEEGKVTEELPEAKRFSFIVGENETTHTAEEQLEKLIGNENTYQDILNTFSIEKVTKDFFIEVAEAFRKLIGGKERINNAEKDFGEGMLRLPKTDANIKKEFAIRLIDRLIFCWFLKKKKSNKGKPIIDDKILSSESVSNYKKTIPLQFTTNSYYHDIIEPLFFEVMNKRQKDRIERYKNIKEFNDIPFLNGGLFEPNKESDFYEFDKNSRTAKNFNTVKIPDEWFKDFFKTLETYNFTVDENTPVEVTLSVDPEMLGRIFENLLAEINPETGEVARKSTGSYYTPRTIVEFMVNESLKYYLTDKTGIEESKIQSLLSYSSEETELTEEEKDKILNALNSIKVLDPACGSGAFPMGMLQKILLILQKVDPDNKKWFEKFLSNIPDTLMREKTRRKFEDEELDYIRKLSILKQSIYGVDIQPMATEISRLRAFLSLIVDTTVRDDEDNRGIEPLPNLDFKFVTANSLIDIDKLEVQKEDQLIVDPFFEKFNRLTQEYFAISDTAKKNKIRREIENLIDSKVNEKLGHIDELSKVLDSRFGISKENKKKIEKLNYETTLWKSYKNIFKNKPVGFFNPKYFFPDTKNGFDIVIANPPYVNIYNIPPFLVKYLKENYQSAFKKFDLYVVFIEMGINLLKDNGVITYIVPDKWISQPYGQKLRNLILEKCKIVNLIDLTKQKIFRATVDNFIFTFIRNKKNKSNYFIYTTDIAFSNKKYIKQSKLQKDAPFLLNISNVEEKILKKIDAKSIRIKDICYVNWGCRPSPKVKYVVDHKINSLYKPLIVGRNIKKYHIEPNKRWVKYISSMYNPLFKELFENTTIVLRDIIGKGNLIAALNTKNYYSDHSVINLLQWDKYKNSSAKHKKLPFEYNKYSYYNLKFILGIINSKLTTFYFNKNMRNGLHTLPNNVKRLPVPKITNEDQNPFIDLVDKILAITQKEDYNPKGDSEDNKKVEEYEKQIDQLVYKLYNLTDDEIKLIEGKVQ